MNRYPSRGRNSAKPVKFWGLSCEISCVIFVCANWWTISVNAIPGFSLTIPTSLFSGVHSRKSWTVSCTESKWRQLARAVPCRIISSPLPLVVAQDRSSHQNPAPAVAALPMRPSRFSKNPPLLDPAAVSIVLLSCTRMPMTPTVSDILRTFESFSSGSALDDLFPATLLFLSSLNLLKVLTALFEIPSVSSKNPWVLANSSAAGPESLQVYKNRFWAENFSSIASKKNNF